MKLTKKEKDFRLNIVKARVLQTFENSIKEDMTNSLRNFEWLYKSFSKRISKNTDSGIFYVKDLIKFDFKIDRENNKVYIDNFMSTELYDDLVRINIEVLNDETDLVNSKTLADEMREKHL